MATFKKPRKVHKLEREVMRLQERQGKNEVGLQEKIDSLKHYLAQQYAKFGVSAKDAAYSGLIKAQGSIEDFYSTRGWLALRYKALSKNDGRCELCGRSKHDGVILHVDHIKPRSKHPELAMRLSKLQILCNECNIGKGNRCDKDWR
jgi:5-methylcytosine-specific restriction endonuclease McrA